METVDILAIGVHPDDIELGCSGTLAKHLDQGYKVGLCDLTRGELGSRGSAELRMEEAEKARKIMGAQWRVNLGMRDGFFEYSETNILKIIQVVRAAKPRIVLANALDDRHPDHGRAAKLIADACFYSGLLRITTKLDEEEQDHWRPEAVFHYIQDKEVKPDFVVDISDYFEKKIACIKAFASQFYQDKDGGPQTPISSQQFRAFVEAKSRVAGRDVLVDYAEGFHQSRLHAVEDLFHLK